MSLPTYPFERQRCWLPAPAAAAQLDLASVVLSLATFLPFIYGLKELARNGLQLLPILAIIAGIAAGAALQLTVAWIAGPSVNIPVQ